MTLNQHPFGQREGQPVDLFTLTTTSGLEARITNFGGIIVNLLVPDRAGQRADVVLGFDSLDDYLKPHPFFGALIGRVANRTGGARFTLNGRTYQLVQNEGQNQLHGGSHGFDKAVWTAEDASRGSTPALRLTHLSPDGDQGYPGAVQVTVTYSLTDDNALRIDYEAVPDQDTVINLTNHAYFNLAGAGSGTILDHHLRIDADHFTSVDAEMITTGELRPVAGTPFDFRQATPIGQRIEADDEQLRIGAGYDHNFALNQHAADTPVIEVTDPRSGRVMQVSTSMPGVQFYSGNRLGQRPLVGKGGMAYGPRFALCLETQHFPNAANLPAFPSPVVRAGETYRHWTTYRFSQSG